MARVTAIFLSCVLLTAGSLQASSVEETYQAALTQEKGEGNLKEAIRLYKQVVEAHEKGEGDEKMAARAQLRIGVCQEKLGLAQARQTYEAVRDKYPDQPQVEAEAEQRLESAHQREATIEAPSSLTASEFEIRRRPRYRQWPSRLGDPDSVLVVIQDTEGRIDSAHISEQMRRQLRKIMERAKQQKELTERQLGAVQRQLEQQLNLMERQLKVVQRNPLRDARIRPRHFLAGGSDQRYYHYANTPPVIPYAYEQVAEVPVQWKFHLDSGEHPQRHRAYAAPDFDDSDWDVIDIGQAWEDQGYEGYDEGAWYRARIKVDAKEGRPVLMAFGGIDKDAYVYVNGQWVGQHKVWNWPFILDISDQVVRNGENVVALYVYDGVNMGGVYGLINVHQPTDKVKTDNFAVNRGGRLEMVDERNNWPVFKDHFASGKRYSRYARRPPRISYAYNKVAEVPVQWKFHPYPEEYQGDQDPILSAADFDDSDWATIDIGQAWEDQGYEGYDEGAWYRTQIEVDAEKGRPVHLAFGGVDNNAYVYVNGIFVGEHHGWNTPFILDISEAVKYKGQNAIAVRVYDGMEMGGIFGTIEVIQPTVKENLDRYLANRGISAQQKHIHHDAEEKRSFWSRFF